jgi:hypothetical protein
MGIATAAAPAARSERRVSAAAFLDLIIVFSSLFFMRLLCVN